MKYITNRIKIHFLPALAAMMIIFSSCNKAVEDLGVPAPAVQGTTPTLATLLDAADMTIFKAAVVKAGLLPMLSTTTLRFTLFAPNDAAMTASGLSLATINGMPVTTVTLIASYHIVPQVIASTSIPNTFPNWFYPTHLNPTTGTPGFNPLVRFTTHPSSRNGYWVNNIPITALDIQAVNGVMHKVALATAPPSRVLWQRIAVDPDMTYLAAAIQRADSGVAPTSSASLVWVLSNFGPNVNVFAPTNAAFQAVLTAQITAYLISIGVPPATAAATAAALASSPTIFSNPLVAGVLTPTVVKGIVVYHMMGYRVFTNNFPTTATSYPTLLNGGIPAHPGVSLVCTFTGLSVTAASVKGIANATPSNILINPTPDPGGTSDQHFVNGTLHKINQVLLPQ